MASKRARRRRRAATQARGGAKVTRKQARRARSRVDRGADRGSRIRQAGIIAPLIRTGLALAKSPLGRKALTVLRQKGSNLPGFGRFAGRTRRASTMRPSVMPRTGTGREIAVRQTSVARRVTTTAAKVAAGGVAFEAGSTLFSTLTGRGDSMPSRRRGGSAARRTQSIPFTPGGIVPTDSIVHTWVANGVPFAQLADGRVMVRRNNGTIKTFRRPRPIVLGRNPGVRDIIRADKKIDALLKVVRKRLPAARTRRPAPQHSQTHN